MTNAQFFQFSGQKFGGFNGSGTDQNRLLSILTILQVFADCREFVLLGEEYQVCLIIADHVSMGGYNNHFKTIYLLKFERLGIGRAGHSGQRLIHAKIILKGD